MGELRLSGNHTVTEYEISDKLYSHRTKKSGPLVQDHILIIFPLANRVDSDQAALIGALIRAA